MEKNEDIEMVEGAEFGVFWGNSLFKQVIDKSPIIEDFIYTNDVICISADAGVGKSILALQILCSVTSAQPFLGTYKVPKAGNVCYLQTEGDRGETIDRIRAMAGGMDVDNNRWVHINLAGICLNTLEGMNELKKLMEAPRVKYDLIIVDPLYTTVKGSMSKDEVATDWIRNVREIKKTFKNCAMIILHHVPKDNYVDGVLMPKSMFGSAMWKAYVNYSYHLVKKDGRHVLTIDKKRNDKVGFDQLEMKMIEPFPLMYVYAEDDPSGSKAKVREYLHTSKEHLSAKQLMDKLKMPKATMFRVLKMLCKEGVLVKTFDDNKVVGYMYREHEEE